MVDPLFHDQELGERRDRIMQDLFSVTHYESRMKNSDVFLFLGRRSCIGFFWSTVYFAELS
jgi:hypothetical protein